jgi:tripeptide aminopeptidase
LKLNIKNCNIMMTYTVKERFLKYVQIDTQADPQSSTFPSSAKQLDLTRILCEEFAAMGVNYKTNEAGYIYAFLDGNTPTYKHKIFFCAHIDTAPDCSGTHVKPLIHSNYDGRDIILPDDNTQILTPLNHPNLAKKTGHDIITASGLTLLGADDKAGVAIILDVFHQLTSNPEIKHGPIRALITTDEEIGKGIAKVDIKEVDADFGYTLDGGEIGSYEAENFSADSFVLTIHGVSAHPGYAKGKMENAIKIAAEIISKLPKSSLTPETADINDGFIHPTKITGQLENAKIEFILRDFNTENLDKFQAKIEEVAKKVLLKYPGSTFVTERKYQYRNMKDVLKKDPHITEIAISAMKNCGIEPKVNKIRGGTDGAGLSILGLPCPNLFAGQQAIHSKQEWISVRDMQKAVDVCIEISKLIV